MSKLPSTSGLPKIAEHIAVNWVEAVVTPPASVAMLVNRYRDLVFYQAIAEPASAEEYQIDTAMDAIYERLKLAAEREHRACLMSQFFRVDRPVLPLQRQWDQAIANWRQGRAS
jgi:hypothetical protein